MRAPAGLAPLNPTWPAAGPFSRHPYLHYGRRQVGPDLSPGWSSPQYPAGSPTAGHRAVGSSRASACDTSRGTGSDAPGRDSGRGAGAGTERASCWLLSYRAIL
eukprot:scaffold1293_cov375-Prasinococcus_capsulatus_cf.AAC.3